VHVLTITLHQANLRRAVIKQDVQEVVSVQDLQFLHTTRFLVAQVVLAQLLVAQVVLAQQLTHLLVVQVVLAQRLTDAHCCMRSTVCPGPTMRRSNVIL